VLGTTHPKKLPLEDLIGLLEEHEEDFPFHVTKAHQRFFTGLIASKK